MSFKAKLEVEEKSYNILNINYSLAQETDPTGRPSSQTRGGRIEVSIESTGETDIFEWMTNSFERKDGKIIFIKMDTNTTLKELYFFDGYVVKYKENFDSYGKIPLIETFTISAKSIKMGTGEHVNEWI
ncbi:hypothetical protein Ga0061079_103119 [Apibacter mensalis]|uniref:Phage tail protein n=1 Tax=Apibacter mensalis TaxID=1586267 RepID=A0A0X8XXK9_9FLAO|nr:type VI secretion system tube protein TssD [Apibacter mensalis]CVK15809.1 hypothetical protein Ga0061079_103119 [Apibacter mensalis]